MRGERRARGEGPFSRAEEEWEEGEVAFAVEGERDAAQDEEGHEKRGADVPFTDPDLCQLQLQCTNDINPVAHTWPCVWGGLGRGRELTCVSGGLGRGRKLRCGC